MNEIIAQLNRTDTKSGTKTNTLLFANDQVKTTDPQDN
jgi:hypothetical protein